ncbi:Creatinase aminopeptidase [Coniophora puteana RWD-64-598 SS2]|uniref:Creatinase aminopeptidase n=1 Tax=Coniophora puteana (strain RWD-64-598) TaxID=741705 RepID=R7SDW3_CONPW|nr:Creatinase aminopeptidase [Coniophora puteana RWD-64-598 SS2]EIW74358.1 Creatinase aminopeptidase [Coniophora puteana RWD-64-598 SS2]
MGGGTHTVNTTDRLAGLRDLMKKPEHNLKAVVVTSEDQHFSEYIAACDERRAWISGFNGSAGCAIVTLDKAFLFTDGRYFLQAEQQLDRHGMGMPDVPTWQDFLWKNLEQGTRIGIDPTLISAKDAETLKTSLTPRASELVSLEKNLVDVVWGSERPARPQNKIFPLPDNYTGESLPDKLARLREELTKKNAKAMVINMLDEVAWLFNLRGADIDYNPVFFAYAVVTHDSATLFVNKDQFDSEVEAHLGSNVEIRPYDSFFDYLKTLPGTLSLAKESPIILGTKVSLAVAEAIGHDNVSIIASPVELMKAVKNSTEVEGFRNCHIRDGAALTRYFAWLEDQLNKGAVLNESQAADQLEAFRKEQDKFVGLSFPTISSTGPNAAIIHYQPTPDDCAVIKKDQIYLCDSGAQFRDGTTDVTRTWHFGTPTDEEKRAFTRVLQGHIAIDTAIFPINTTGYVIDSFARRPLWQDGLDYRHGTGHGVGHFLNVHEGPHGIGTRIAYNNTPLKPGMIVSNEPGYYADGSFGIRIENIVVVQEAQTRYKFGNGYLKFEHVTMCPMQKTLIDLTLLTSEEKGWLNAYHAEILEKVSPLIQNDLLALEWLKRECSPL